jgi:methyltransferase (TIGR00027 family)
MTMARDPLVRNISDTALWVAHYRAAESERPDALFTDPFARRLAGERGERIAKAQTFGDRNAWSFVARTVLFDRFIDEAVRGGADLVVNLAAGLDMRPYRMQLPPGLRWVEVDLPAILDYKEAIVGDAVPICRVERIRQDLADRPARRALLARLGAGAAKAVVVTEGLIIYLSRDEVAALAADIGAVPAFGRWVIDLCSPGLLKMMTRQGGDMIAAAGAPFKFAPPEGPDFFVPLGWRPERIASLLKTAAQLRRLPMMLRLIALLPESPTPPPNRPWSAVMTLVRA